MTTHIKPTVNTTLDDIAKEFAVWYKKQLDEQINSDTVFNQMTLAIESYVNDWQELGYSKDQAIANRNILLEMIQDEISNHVLGEIK